MWEGDPVTAWSQDTLTLLAHAVHYALVAGGLIGLGWLLVTLGFVYLLRRVIVANKTKD